MGFLSNIGNSGLNVLSLGAKNAAQSATNEQVTGLNSQQDWLKQLYGQTREDFSPYRNVGTTAIPRLTDLLGITGNFDPNLITRTPGYQFGLDQGINALDRSAASKGVLGTGGYGRGLTRYGQDYAMANGYNDYYKKLSDLINLGLGATSQTAGYGANIGGQIGQGYANIGNAKAGGYLADAAANKSAFQNLAQIVGMAMGVPTGMGGGSPSSFQSPNLNAGTYYGDPSSNLSNLYRFQ